MDIIGINEETGKQTQYKRQDSIDVRSGGGRFTISDSDLRSGESRFIGKSESGEDLYAVGE